MARYHLTDNGAKPCTATERSCPIGGVHFATQEEAETAYEFHAQKKFNPFAALKKKVDPYSKPLATTEARLKAMEKELQMRDSRLAADGLKGQLIAEGFSENEIINRDLERFASGDAGLKLQAFEGNGAKVLGVQWSGGAKYAHAGELAKIRHKLHSGEFKPEDLKLTRIDGFTVLALKASNELGFGRDISIDPVNISAKEAIEKYDQKEGSLIDQERRQSAEGEIAEKGAFVLVTKDPLEASFFQKLKEANDAGALRFAAAHADNTTPFLYDNRDLGRNAKAIEIKKEEFEKAAAGYISDVKANFESAPGQFWALEPEASSSVTDVRQVGYWLHFTPPGQSEIKGVFSREELVRILDYDYSMVQR